MTYEGGADGFHKLMMQLTASKGKVLCRYPSEEAKVQDAKCIPKAIAAEDDLLLLLHKASKELAFPKTAVESGLRLTLKSCNSLKNWRLNEADGKDWVETIGRRIRNLCRVVAQPLSKGRCPKWIKTLTFYKKMNAQHDADEDAEIDAEVAAATAAAPAAEDGSSEEAEEEEEADADEGDSATGTEKPTLVVSFCKELMLATRHDVAVGQATKETSLPIEICGETALDKMTLVQATFKDGSKALVPGLTVASYRQLLKRGDGEKTKVKVLWSSHHVETKHLIYVQQRIDRQLLLSLYEQTRQRLQIRVDVFGPVEDQGRHLPRDSAVLARALDFMRPIAEKFAAGLVEHKELINLRNEMIKALATTSTPVKKRPASAEVASEPQAAPAQKMKEEAKTSKPKKPKPEPKPEASNPAKARYTIIDAGEYQELARPPAMSLLEQFLLNDASASADNDASARSSNSL